MKTDKEITERELIIQIAKAWPGHAGVNFESTTSKNLLLLIKDAMEAARV